MGRWADYSIRHAEDPRRIVSSAWIQRLNSVRQFRDKSFAIVEANLDWHHVRTRFDCVGKRQRPRDDCREYRDLAVERVIYCFTKNTERISIGPIS